MKKKLTNLEADVLAILTDVPQSEEVIAEKLSLRWAERISATIDEALFQLVELSPEEDEDAGRAYWEMVADYIADTGNRLRQALEPDDATVAVAAPR